MAYEQSVRLHDIVTIKKLVNIARNCSDKNFLFEGESHSFWEFQYVEKGSVIVHANNEFYELCQGQAVFFAPDEFHILWGNGRASAEFWVFAFHCDSPALGKLNQLILNVPERCRRLMEELVLESEQAVDWGPPPTLLHRRPELLFGFEQILKNNLETLLVLLLRLVLQDPKAVQHRVISDGWKPNALAGEIHCYLQNQVHTALTLEQTAARFHISVSYLKKVYRQAFGTSVMADFATMKAHRACELLRETELSVQEIAMLLEFRNIYYFSSWFKTQTGQSPTAYRAASPKTYEPPAGV